MGKQAMQASGLVVLCLMVGACNQENAEEPPPIVQADSVACESSIREIIDLEFTAPDGDVARIKQEIQNQMTEDM